MRHKAEEIREDRQWTAWQAIKLQNLQKFRRENRQIMQEYSDKIDADTRQLMTEQFREGEQEAEAVAGAEPAASVPDVHFFGVNTPKMERLMQDVVQVEQTAETAALRTMDDVYRRTVNRAQLAMAAGETTLTKAIDMAVREFLEKGLNSIVYRDGRHVDIADYVRMVLRTTSTRAQLQGKSKRFAELGYDTVLISQYGGCSETCEPWQGRAYIDDVFTIWNGEINGDSGKSRYCDKWFPLLSSAIRGGLFHPNCRHTMSLYIDGVTKIPHPIPAEQIRKQRELEQKQRVMERKIRKLKRLEAGTQDPQAVKEYGRKARAAQQELNAFVDEHRDVLKRDYEREKYYGSGVDKTKKYGIIKLEEVKNMTINSIERPIELPIEQRHTGKGNPNAVLTFGVELNNRQKNLLEQLSEFDSRIVVNKKSVNMADLSALTAHTGDEFALFTKGKDRLVIRGNSSMVNLDTKQAEKLAEQGYRWSGHTHPGVGYNCLVASLGDHEILKCFKHNTSVIYNSKGQYLTFQKE
nr:MAG TPA: minor capsid protein [Caudoviricetes sp.]